MGVPIKHRTQIGNVDFVAGGTKHFDIPRLGVLLELMLRVAFTITSGGSSAPATPNHQWLARIIRQASVKVNGRDTVWSLPGYSIASMAYIERKGRVARGMDAAAPSATSTAYTYEIFLPIRFYLPHAVRADDTGLDLRAAPATLQLDWTAADCSDLFTTPNSAVISAVTCEVSGLYHQDPPDNFIGPDGKPMGPRTWKVRQLDHRLIDLSATNNKFPIVIDEGTGVFQRSLMIEALAANVGNASMLGNGLMELKVSNVTFQSINARHLLADMEDDLSAAPQVGVYKMDFPLFGSGATMIPTANLPANLILYLEATKQSGTNQFAVTREAFRDILAFG